MYTTVQIKLASNYLEMTAKEFFGWEPDMLQRVEFKGAEVLFNFDRLDNKTREELVQKALSLEGKPLFTFGSCLCGDCWGGFGQIGIKHIVLDYHGRAECVVMKTHDYRDWSRRISFEEASR